MWDSSREECEAHPSVPAPGRGRGDSRGTPGRNVLSTPVRCGRCALNGRLPRESGGRRGRGGTSVSQAAEVCVRGHPSGLGSSLRHAVACACRLTAERTRTREWPPSPVESSCVSWNTLRREVAPPAGARSRPEVRVRALCGEAWPWKEGQTWLVCLVLPASRS